jgi:hypothetical protein
VRRHDEILAANVREVVVFHSTAEELLRHAADLQFAVVADPEKRLYAEFGVESASRALLDPRAWRPVLRTILHRLRRIIREGQSVPPINPHGGRLGVVACRYGEHVYDQWSVNQVLNLARLHAGERNAGRRTTPASVRGT